MEDQNPKPTSQERIAKAYLLSQISKLAAAANVAASRETIALYAQELGKLKRVELDNAIQRTILEWDKPSMLPTLPFILARKGLDPKLIAEQDFELTQKLIRRDWYAEGLGWQGKEHRFLSPAARYAIRQCGGEHRFAYAPEDTFTFLRRDFIAAHERFQAADGKQVRLTEGEARDILGELMDGLRRLKEGENGEADELSR